MDAMFWILLLMISVVYCALEAKVFKMRKEITKRLEYRSLITDRRHDQPQGGRLLG